ncbi:MAG: DNA starvation/stationary phase protection protein [Mycoplasmataceae bacterium]|nr:DNA starvation/stationary phase protection protein [Mycoplasmataceae bacterium]
MKKNIESLKDLQASLMVLTNKIYNFHWNMKTEHFFSLHKNTEDLFEDLTGFYDDVAEKIVMLGDLAIGTLKDQLLYSKISEVKEKEFDQKEISKMIVKDLTIIIELCDKVEGTNVVQPMLDEIYMSADKWRWQFRKLI